MREKNKRKMKLLEYVYLCVFLLVFLGVKKQAAFVFISSKLEECVNDSMD